MDGVHTEYSNVWPASYGSCQSDDCSLSVYFTFQGQTSSGRRLTTPSFPSRTQASLSNLEPYLRESDHMKFFGISLAVVEQSRFPPASGMMVVGAPGDMWAQFR